MPNTRIACRDFVASLAEYQEGEMRPRRRELFDAHLSRCAKCSSYLKSYATTVKLAKEAYSDAGSVESHDMPEDLVESIMASRSKR